MAAVLKVASLVFPFTTPDPFLFCVYHKDAYPAGDAEMQAPRKGNGADFNPSAPYRMYHGDRVPGFPQHPHRGFETLTATIDGIVDHTDSLGNGGRFGHGDLQWMTAGKGVVHCEMFPLVHTDRPNPLRFFQVWLNLPKRNKLVDPAYIMHWGPKIPKVQSADGLTRVTVYAGGLLGAHGLPPPPSSWASEEDSEVAVWFLEMQAGARFVLPPCAGGDAINRAIYFFEGKELAVAGNTLGGHSRVDLRGGAEAELHNPHATESSQVLLLQGRPIGEPVAQQGPFVMNSQAEIRQAFADYQRTQFGGWPWDVDAPTFPADKPRFSTQNGVTEHPEED